jgi:hypothetical protein
VIESGLLLCLHVDSNHEYSGGVIAFDMDGTPNHNVASPIDQNDLKSLRRRYSLVDAFDCSYICRQTSNCYQSRTKQQDIVQLKEKLEQIVAALSVPIDVFLFHRCRFSESVYWYVGCIASSATVHHEIL